MLRQAAQQHEVEQKFDEVPPMPDLHPPFNHAGNPAVKKKVAGRPAPYSVSKHRQQHNEMCAQDFQYNFLKAQRRMRCKTHPTAGNNSA